MIAIVTGASSGIGREFSKQIDSKGYEEIWLIARRKFRLEELANNLNTKSKILEYDLLDDDTYIDFQNILIEENPKVDLLINAAGVGISDSFENIGANSNSQTIRLNVEALTKITSITLPFIQNGGTIINISSVAAFLPQPNFATYAASKSYVLSFSRALNVELKKRKIHVSCLCPNPVDTEFFDKTDKKKSNDIKKIGTENISNMVAKSLKFANKKDLIVTHPISRAILIFSKILPHSFILWFEKILKIY